MTNFQNELIPNNTKIVNKLNKILHRIQNRCSNCGNEETFSSKKQSDSGMLLYQWVLEFNPASLGNK